LTVRTPSPLERTSGHSPEWPLLFWGEAAKTAPAEWRAPFRKRASLVNALFQTVRLNHPDTQFLVSFALLDTRNAARPCE